MDGEVLVAVESEPPRRSNCSGLAAAQEVPVMLWTFGISLACLVAAALLIPVVTFFFPEAQQLRTARAPTPPPAPEA